MTFWQRRRNEDQGQADGLPNGGGTGDSAAIRRARRDFLATGDRAISKALRKGGSQAFLAAKKHQGGG